MSGRSTQATGWVEVRLFVPLGWHELVAEALTVEPCTSVVFGRTSIGMPEPPAGFDLVRTYYPARADTPEVRGAVRARVTALAAQSGIDELASIDLTFRTLPPEDYATSWRKTWRPFRVGRVCVLPPWHTYDLRHGELRLTLEPGGVFGTGRHATTRACLRLLQELVKHGDRIIDAGTGSGILAVACALLGAREVFGFDVDPNSGPAAEELAADNGVAAACTFETGGFERLGRAPREVDGVLANIYADVVQEHAQELAAALRPAGWFITSGCLDAHASPTRAALESTGLAIEHELLRGRWLTFVGRRR